MTHLSVKYDSIISITMQHRHISKLFNTHQQMIMRGDIICAYEIFQEFKKYVRSHIEAENDYLLPLYEKYVSPIPIGGAVEFFIHEHHKIYRYMEKFSGKSLNLKKNYKHSNINIVKLFDEHYIFKHLLDHHHLREDTFLFRLLDRVLGKEEINEVLLHFSFNHI